MAREKKIGDEGGGRGGEGDLENCAYLWKNPGYAPDKGSNDGNPAMKMARQFLAISSSPQY